MSDYQKKYAEHHVLLDRYESLISQYKADLERLDFISRGEEAVRELPPNDVRPFCGGEIHIDPDDSYMDAIHAEIRRIASELTVVAATERNVSDDESVLKKRIEDLQVRCTKIDKTLDEKNREVRDY